MSSPFLVLFEPEIPNNVGSLIRLSACFSSKLVIIRPVGFIWDASKLKRSAMDYFHLVDIEFFDSFLEFKQSHKGRIIGTSVGFGETYYNVDFQENDAIVMGKESVGLPQDLYKEFDLSVTIPINARSLNLAISASILLANASIK